MHSSELVLPNELIIARAGGRGGPQREPREAVEGEGKRAQGDALQRVAWGPLLESRAPGQGPPPGEAGRPDSSGTTPHPTPPAPRLALCAVPLPARAADPAEHRADASLQPSSMLPLYRWENRSPWGLNNLLKATHVVGGRAGIQPGLSDSQVCAFTHHFLWSVYYGSGAGREG